MTNDHSDSDRPAPAGHVVVVGNDRLGGRIVEELGDLDVELRVICEDPSSPIAAAARAAGATLVIGAPHDRATLDRAEADRASACALVCDDDLANLNATLALRDIATSAALVVRMDDGEFGAAVQTLIGPATILTPALLAGRGFVQAALRDRAPFVLVVGDRRLAVLEVDAGDPRLLLAIAGADGTAGTAGTLFPTGEGRVIGIVDQGRVAREVPTADLGALDVRIATRQAGLVEATTRFARAWSTSARFLRGILDRRLGVVAALFLVAVSLSTFAFATLLGLDVLDSLYFVVVTVTTTGYGDISLLDAPWEAKLLGMVLMGFGVLTLSLIVAVVADSVLGARMSLALGHGALPRGGHVVVCGAGDGGIHILRMLTEAGIACVAVERDGEHSPAFLRENKIPLVIGDVTKASTVARLRLGSARALISLTNDDLTNISCALQVRAQAPDLRVVLRMFDADLARRMERATGYVSRSVVSLATPAFVAAVLGFRAAGTVPIGRDSVRVVWMRTTSEIDLDALERGHEVRVLAVDVPDFPYPDEPIPPGTELLVVCTRLGMAHAARRLGRP